MALTRDGCQRFIHCTHEERRGRLPQPGFRRDDSIRALYYALIREAIVRSFLNSQGCLNGCMGLDLIDEPIHGPELVIEAVSGNFHGDVTDAGLAIGLYVADYVLNCAMQREPVISAERTGNVQVQPTG